MNKIKKYLCIAVLLLPFHTVRAQSLIFQKDTVFVFIFRSTLDNGRPQVAYTIYKQLDSFPSLKKVYEQERALCSLFEHGILFEEPFFTLEKNIKYYGFTTKEDANNFLSELTKKNY